MRECFDLRLTWKHFLEETIVGRAENNRQGEDISEVWRAGAPRPF